MRSVSHAMLLTAPRGLAAGGQRKHASPAAILALFDDRPGRQTTQADGGTAGGGKEPDTADATQQN